ncbi:DUF924 family protein [Dyella caseinilytica]|uniref:DUF924 domain-containing protein n=1 Tax=Dyella caseinilytica TaxID=1849581 RepID=A0ABX7GT49_9GAMM|nr:DUF924 family protein [Dyella caseinilytica]QRN53148.1 DUF924 domain-containing protein [Dyella caseinilytica]GGA11831.1 hypothetical protein GCM10011408_36570 [Dyella caseinilytica]
MANTPRDASAVLAFWFDPAHHDEWYASHPAFDALIRERFAHQVELAAAGKLMDWAATLEGWLALLIVLDQFPRNLYRRDSRAWAQDLRAQQLALSGIEEGFDRQLPAIQRVFAYMPLEHAEDIELQRRAVTLFEALCNDVPPDERDRYDGFLDYARRHEAVIARFGRFPHRNGVLGRVSTSEEQRYLAEPGAGF